MVDAGPEPTYAERNESTPPPLSTALEWSVKY